MVGCYCYAVEDDGGGDGRSGVGSEDCCCDGDDDGRRMIDGRDGEDDQQGSWRRLPWRIAGDDGDGVMEGFHRCLHYHLVIPDLDLHLDDWTELLLIIVKMLD